MQKFWILPVTLFSAGIAGAHFFGKDFLTTYGFLNEYHLMAFAQMKIDEVSLFWNILWERGKLLLGIGILLATPFRRIVPVLLVGGFSFALGFFSSACVMNLGVGGVGVSLFFWIPHGIFYVLAVLALLYFVNHDIYGSYHRIGKRQLLSCTLYPLFLLVLLVVGSLLEATAGTFFLRLMIRLCLKSAS